MFNTDIKINESIVGNATDIKHYLIRLGISSYHIKKSKCTKNYIYLIKSEATLETQKYLKFKIL